MRLLPPPIKLEWRSQRDGVAWTAQRAWEAQRRAYRAGLFSMASPTFLERQFRGRRSATANWHDALHAFRPTPDEILLAATIDEHDLASSAQGKCLNED